MKNSRCFSTEEWQADPFLSSTELAVCRTLFRDSTTELSVFVVTLPEGEAGPGSRAQADRYLSPAEQERLASFTFAKRHREWLGGRIAAKKASMALLVGGSSRQVSYHELVVETHSTGRPFLRWQGAQPPTLPAISISHSGNYAGAIAARGHACGLDLQRITAKVITIRERFAVDAELALVCAICPSLDEAAALTLLWSAKEALRKAIDRQPLMGFTEIGLCTLSGDPESGLIGHFACQRPKPLPVFLCIREAYACAITVVGHPA